MRYLSWMNVCIKSAKQICSLYKHAFMLIRNFECRSRSLTLRIWITFMSLLANQLSSFRELR